MSFKEKKNKTIRGKIIKKRSRYGCPVSGKMP